MDANNYDNNLEEIVRTAVRGIIFINGKLLMIENRFHEVKLPGGGMESGESDLQTLIREVKEETGYDVIPESVTPFGQVEEKRLSKEEMKIWHQFSRLYFCYVYPKQGDCNYTESEKSSGFHQVVLTLDEAIEKNQKFTADGENHSWSLREYNTLKIIKNYLDDKTN